jgi:ketosteroid isomerase-like protein
MSEEEQLIKVFYTCFQKLDWKGMLDCYHEEVFFYDPVFENLEGPQVRAMWEMLLSNAKDLQLSFSNIQADPAKDSYGSCDWVATYTFSQTGRRVVNKGKALFTFSEGKIAEHHDNFDLWRWSRQALGIPGILFGWTPVLQNKIRQKARRSLEKFMTRYAPGKS